MSGYPGRLHLRCNRHQPGGNVLHGAKLGKPRPLPHQFAVLLVNGSLTVITLLNWWMTDISPRSGLAPQRTGIFLSVGE